MLLTNVLLIFDSRCLVVPSFDPSNLTSFFFEQLLCSIRVSPFDHISLSRQSLSLTIQVVQTPGCLQRNSGNPVSGGIRWSSDRWLDWHRCGYSQNGFFRYRISYCFWKHRPRTSYRYHLHEPSNNRSPPRNLKMHSQVCVFNL